jgi:hypothetical protein
MQVIKMHIWDLINTVRSQNFAEESKDKYYGYALLNPDESFTGISSVNDIDKILNAPVQKNNEIKAHNKAFDMLSDVSGSVVNMDAYLAGEPEDMYNFVSSESNIVEELNIFYAIPASVPVQQIADAAMRLKEYIEQRPANVSFNINIRSDYQGLTKTGAISKKENSIQLLAASAEDYLTDQLINLLGSPMFFRYFLLHHRFTQLDSNTIGMKTPEGYINFLHFNKTWS